MVKEIPNFSIIFSRSSCYGVPYIKICKARVDYIRFICKWEEVKKLMLFYFYFTIPKF
jgi:hypothetical protein